MVEYSRKSDMHYRKMHVQVDRIRGANVSFTSSVLLTTYEALYRGKFGLEFNFGYIWADCAKS